MSNDNKANDLNELVYDANNALNTKEEKLQKRSLHFPPLTPAILVVILLGVLIYNFELYFNPHPEPGISALASGERFALKAIAEDIETYRTVYGKLPDKLPNSNAISAIVNIKYEKIDNEKFTVYMNTVSGEYTLNQDGEIEVTNKRGN